MTKSEYAEAVDEIRVALRPLMKVRGFKVRARTFNRLTEDGLTQVVSLQMGASGPPGAKDIPGLRENLHGFFTVNLGVYVPEVAKCYGGQARSWVYDHHCCVRSRLGTASGEECDVWWRARPDDSVVDDVSHRLESGGLPFLERFSTRDKILAEWSDRPENVGAGGPPRIVMAIIVAERGETERARAMLAQQVMRTRNSRHADYVRGLARELGVGNLDA